MTVEATRPLLSPSKLEKTRNAMAYAPGPEEAQLVEGCRRGDGRAQKKLFEKYYGKMLGVCLRYANNREEARDILQDGFIKVFSRIQQFTFSSPLEAWIRRIMVNTAIDAYRHAATQPVANDIETAHGIPVENDIISNMAHADLLECLQDLPTGYRMVFNMYAVEGYTHKEIGEALNITEGTSKSQLAKARAYIQRLLAKRFAENG